MSRLLADAEFFKTRISKIDGAGDLGDEIVKVVQGKSVAQIEAAAAAPTSAPEIPSVPPTGPTPQPQLQPNENDAKAASAGAKEDQKS